MPNSTEISPAAVSTASMPALASPHAASTRSVPSLPSQAELSRPAATAMFAHAPLTLTTISSARTSKRPEACMNTFTFASTSAPRLAP